MDDLHYDAFRSYQVSDHLPKWMELRIDEDHGGN